MGPPDPAAPRRIRRRPPPTHAVHASRLGFRPDEAAAVIGSEGVFRDMRDAGWIQPIYHSNNVTLFDYADLVRAFARLRAGERPTTK